LIGFEFLFGERGDKDVKKEVNKTIGYVLDFLIKVLNLKK
jgi:hypothetical protein